MDKDKKKRRYERIQAQLKDLLGKSSDEQARMATVIAILHHKMDHFFWTGFYTLRNGKLIVNMYQGPAACMELKKDTGVCWAAINSQKAIVVPDVHRFPGHIACDSRSKSEICLPFRNHLGVITAVLDVDSDVYDNFDSIDETELQAILELINNVPYSLDP